MSAIFFPWMLAALFVVICVADVRHSPEDRNVLSATEDQPVPRDDNSDVPDELKNITHVKRRPPRNYWKGAFEVCITIGEQLSAGGVGNIYVQVVFETNKKWGEEKLFRGFTFAGEYCETIVGRMYYGEENRVKELKVRKTQLHDKILIKKASVTTPGDCRYSYHSCSYMSTCQEGVWVTKCYFSGVKVLPCSYQDTPRYIPKERCAQ